jgi:c-di-GMP-binding flagellar brake protein YcgR
MDDSERRRENRICVQLPIYYELGESRFRGQLRDLSDTGAFVWASAVHEEKDRVRLSWHRAQKASKTRFEAWATIVRVEESTSYEGAPWPGFALRFEPQDPEVQRFVDAVASAWTAFSAAG